MARKLTSMLATARASNDLMQSIARENRGQAPAIEAVNLALRQLDEMTQHNAALVEQTNAAIERTEAHPCGSAPSPRHDPSFRR